MAKKEKTELARMPQVDVAELAAAKKQAQMILSMVTTLVVDSPEKAEKLDQLRAAAEGRFKELDEERLKIVRPLLDAKSAADALFKGTLDIFKGVGQAARKGLADYAVRRAEEEARVLAQVEEAAASGDSELVDAKLAALPPEMEVSASSAALTWEVDKVDLAKVPEAFKVLNQALVDALIASHVKSGSTVAPTLDGVVFRRAAKIRAKRSK
jgi:hypothetical protein